jgi:hypothetical protein
LEGSKDQAGSKDQQVHNNQLQQRELEQLDRSKASERELLCKSSEYHSKELHKALDSNRMWWPLAWST